MQNAAAVIYTSGFDFMHSNKPSALREVVFRPIVEWVNEALDSAGIFERCYVINEGEEDIRKYTGEYPVLIREKDSGHPLFTSKEWMDDKKAATIRASDNSMKIAKTLEKDAELLTKQVNAHVK